MDTFEKSVFKEDTLEKSVFVEEENISLKDLADRSYKFYEDEIKGKIFSEQEKYEIYKKYHSISFPYYPFQQEPNGHTKYCRLFERKN